MGPLEKHQPGEGARAAGAGPGRAGDELRAEWSSPFMPADEGTTGPAYSPPGGRGGWGPPSYSALADERQVAWYVPLVGRLLMLFAIAMIVTAVVGGLTGIGVPARDTNTYTIPLGGTSPTVQIVSTASDIRIQPVASGDPNTITVVESIQVRNISPSLAERSLEVARMAEPKLVDGVVQIVARPQEEWSIFFQRDVDITVYVPQNTTIKLDVQAGSATVERLSGTIDATVSGGHLDLLSMKVGSGSRLAVNGATARLEGELQANASLDVNVTFGNIMLYLPFTTDARLDATAEIGHLDIEGWSGLLTKPVTTSRGRGDINTVSGVLYTNPNPTSQITIRVQGGNATLRPSDTNSGTIFPGPPAPPQQPGAPNAPTRPDAP